MTPNFWTVVYILLVNMHWLPIRQSLINYLLLLRLLCTAGVFFSTCLVYIAPSTCESTFSTLQIFSLPRTGREHCITWYLHGNSVTIFCPYSILWTLSRRYSNKQYESFWLILKSKARIIAWWLDWYESESRPLFYLFINLPKECPHSTPDILISTCGGV